MLSIKGITFDLFARLFKTQPWELLFGNGFANLWRTNEQHIVLQTTDSVAFLIVVQDRAMVLLVNQFRPATLDPEVNPNGVTIEVTAGRFDASLTPLQLVIKEASEEVGAVVGPDQVYFLNDGGPMFLSTGVLTEKQMLAVVMLDYNQIESLEREFGCQKEGEKIKRVWISYHDFIRIKHQCIQNLVFAEWLKNNLKGN